jgi:hypothetical protein
VLALYYRVGYNNDVTKENIMAQVIDTTVIRGSGQYVWRHHATPTSACGAGHMIAFAAQNHGAVYVIDDEQRLEGWLTVESVREEIESDLREVQALAWESEMSDEADCSESAAIGAALKALPSAAITVESITSPRTGRKGWKVTYAA